MNAIGKPLVFVNLLVSVGLLTWALSAYFNRQDLVARAGEAAPTNEDPFADDTSNIDRLQAKISKLTESIRAAQVGYARASVALTVEELRRDDRAARFAARLTEARTGAFKTFVYLPKSALIDVTAPGEPILGVDKQPVRGLDAVQQDLAKSIRDSLGFLDQSEARRNEYKKLAAEVDDLDVRIAKQKDILVQLKDEFDYLSDRRTDWDEQVRTLEKRKRQVAAGLARLSGK